MNKYALIHAVAGLFEGYSTTTCEFFPNRGRAEQLIEDILANCRKIERCVNIDHRTNEVYLTFTRDHKGYHDCISSGMEHDDWVSENGDDVSVEVLRIIEIDMASATQSHWVTWNQQDAEVWDYFPSCVSLVSRVCAELINASAPDKALPELNEFVQSVCVNDHAYIDVDDCTLHALRIPKK